MGPIQASLNQLTLSAFAAMGGLAHGLKGEFKKPEKPKAEQPKAETKSGMGNIAKIGRNKGNTNIKAYTASIKAMESGNDAIEQKARAKFRPLNVRLELIKEATSGVYTQEKKGGSK